MREIASSPESSEDLRRFRELAIFVTIVMNRGSRLGINEFCEMGDAYCYNAAESGKIGMIFL